MADKLTEIISFRVPETLKVMVDRLPAEWKRKAYEEARLAMAKVIHESRFEPNLYLGDEEE